MDAAELSEQVQEAFDARVGDFDGPHYGASVVVPLRIHGPRILSTFFTNEVGNSDPLGFREAMYRRSKRSRFRFKGRMDARTIDEHFAENDMYDVEQGTAFYAEIATRVGVQGLGVSNDPTKYLALLCRTTEQDGHMEAVLQTNDPDYIQNRTKIFASNPTIDLDWQQLIPDA